MDLKRLSDEEVFDLRISLEAELRRRSIKFRVGDVGERLAIAYFSETRGLPTLLDAPVGTKNVDAISRDGDRYSIKTVQQGSKTGTVYPDSTEREKQLFEYMLIVKLDDAYKLTALYRLSWNDFVKVRAWDKRMNAWYVPVNGTRLSNAEQLIDIEQSTTMLRKTRGSARG